MSVYTYTTIDDPSAFSGFTHALGFNDTDQIVGVYSNASGQHGFLLSGGMYITLDDPLAVGGIFASGINASGQIVGYYSDASLKTHGFLYNPNSSTPYTPLDDPLATNGTFATGINASGQIVGYYQNGTGQHGFLLSGGIYTTIDDPSGGTTFANGINAAGQIIGFYTDASNKTHGFLYNPNSSTPYTTVDYPLAKFNTELWGINDTGQIVGTYDGVNSFLYSGGTFTTLVDPLAAGFTEALGINNMGQIVGSYEDGSGGFHGFLLTITPNPPPPAGTTADMILRHGADGQYEVYDIGNNAILAGYQLGVVGSDWQFAGVGGFFGNDTTDMLLRSASTGGFEVYDISNNNITNAAFLGAVGMNWQVMGFGNFSSMPGETDMILRNSNSGGMEVYDISSNQITARPSWARSA